jgi:[ribosomal protein S5]-alanine N-acetyltransferase
MAKLAAYRQRGSALYDAVMGNNEDGEVGRGAAEPPPADGSRTFLPGALVLRSGRLELLEFCLGDDHFVLRLLNDASFLRFIGDKGVRTLEDARAYITQGPMESYRRHGYGLYLVRLRADGSPIGMCGLVKREGLEDPDIGFAFLPQFHSKGYATEAAAAVLDHGRRRLGLARIVAIAAPDNQASIAVLERAGLKFERMVQLPADTRDLKLFGPA